MKKLFSNLLLQTKKHLHWIVIVLLVSSTIFSAYCWFQPTKISSEETENNVKIDTTFDYKATYEKNILFPEGGTFDVGETLVRNLIYQIPLNITSILSSETPIHAKGTHELKIVVQAGEFWEREFPLEEKKSFDAEGTEINLFKDETYIVDYDGIEDFIQEVEEDVSIRPDFYSITVQPNIEGTITYNETTQDIKLQDSLIFQQYFEELILASDKHFSTSLPFTTTKVITNTFNIFGIQIPMLVMKIVSTIIILLFLLTFMYLRKKGLPIKTEKTPLPSEKIYQKHKKRLVPVAKKIDVNEDTIVQLRAFTTLLQIADSKDLPILYYNDPINSNKLYFVIDEGYIYQFKLDESDILLNNKQLKDQTRLKQESDPTYVLDQ